MNKFKLVVLLAFTLNMMIAQNDKLSDQAYVETLASVDTLVMPDKIYLSIHISENDTKGKQTVQQLEKKMAQELEQLGIDLRKQLSLSDISSNFKDFVFRKDDVLKAKIFELLVYDANTASQVIYKLSSIDISSIFVTNTEYSQMEKLMLDLVSIAVVKAADQAKAMLAPLGQSLGKAIYLSDVNTNGIQSLRATVAGVKIRSNYDLDGASQEEILNVEFDKIEVKKTISAKFLIN